MKQSLHAASTTTNTTNLVQNTQPNPCFNRLSSELKGIALPHQFTCPFYYQPHPLVLQAVGHLQEKLSQIDSEQHDFETTGKMFGVLIISDEQGSLGYLAAYSGKFAAVSKEISFVPAVFDMYSENAWHTQEQIEINGINDIIAKLEQACTLTAAKIDVERVKAESEYAFEKMRETMALAKKNRKQQRAQAQESLAGEDLANVLMALSKESVHYKNQLKDLKLLWQQRIDDCKYRLKKMTDIIKDKKKERKERSTNLQQQLFAQYKFLNAHGEEKDLHEIFSTATNLIPPSGTGDCAAPKLLNYAFQMGYQPIAMGEFWWGASPKSEVRQHKNFYPSCQSKCQPILAHMLQGLNVEANPMHSQKKNNLAIDIIYQDDAMLVINKPHELLSVPGKTITDSVFERLTAMFPLASGPLIVHRLDMSTSGLMLITLTKRANKRLQKQFIHRSIKKRYVALIEGVVEQEQGDINLPLRQDLDDRPRQLVCDEYGKPADTHFQVIERTDNRTRLYLYPKTGRTHQLRVHCAHKLGLNMPIVGDDLYGNRGERLHLHAESISFFHPITNEPLNFSVPAPF